MRLTPRALPLNPSLSPLSYSHPCIRRSSFVILGLVSAGVPPLFRRWNSVCVCYIVFLLTACSGEARTSAGTRNDIICHVSSSEALASSLSVIPISIRRYLLACSISNFLFVFCLPLFLFLLLSTPFFISSCFPLK